LEPGDGGGGEDKAGGGLGEGWVWSPAAACVRRGGLGAGQWRRDEVLNTRKGLGEATCSRINPWDYVNLLKHHRRMF
jgi:hypothetical protein